MGLLRPNVTAGADRRSTRSALRASLPAALFSGVPSTVYSLWHGKDVLEPSVAAGSILLRNERRRGRLLLAAIPVHLVLSAGWSLTLARTLPGKRPVIEGTLAGLAIAALDLGLVGSHIPRIRALDPGPQIADHIAFGVIVSLNLSSQKKAGQRQKK